MEKKDNQLNNLDNEQGGNSKEIKTKNNSRKRKIIKGIIEWTIYAIIFVLIVWGTPTALTKILKTDNPIASITSSSMWPALKKGDVVFIKGVNGKDDLRTGDIVVFENIKGFTIHRIAEMRTEVLITKGDANNTDDKPITYDKVIGKTVNFKNNNPIRIPYLGLLSQNKKD